MPTKEECDEMARLADSRYHDIHEHIRELRRDVSEITQVQSSQYKELTEANKETARALTSLTSSIQGLVEVWQATNGAVKVATAIGRFLKWAGGIALALGIAYTAWKTGELPR